MNGLGAIFRRELKAYFDSAIAYIFIIVFLLITCGLFMSTFFLARMAEMRSFFGMMPISMVIFVAAISMRLWAEDRMSGTLELLLTFPIKTHVIVLGKYLASLLFLVISLAGTLVVPIAIRLLGNPDMGPIYGGYAGSILLGSFLLALGLFFSGISKDQIVAFISSLVVGFFFYLIGTDYMATQLDGWTGLLGLGTKLQNYLGLANHFEGIQRGVLDIKDIVYFVSMTLLFLAANTLYLEGRNKPKSKSQFGGAVAVLAAVVIVLNVLVTSFRAGRYDLTEDRLFTVSQSTKTILAKLKVPVSLKFFVTPAEKMPSMMKNLQRDVIDKLKEFEIASNGHLSFTVYDPTADPSMLESLSKRGVMPFQVQSIDKDEIGIKRVYSAISISYLDKPEEIIPAIHPRNFAKLEYELISKIYKLATDAETRKLAMFAPTEKIDPRIIKKYREFGRQIPREQDNYSKLEAVLKQEKYDVKRIAVTSGDTVPDDVKTLLVIDPEKLNERQRYEISRALLKGVNVIFAAQGYLYNYQPGGRGLNVIPRKNNHGLNPLLTNYGVRVSDKLLMDLSHEVLNIPTRRNIAGMFTAMVDTPVKVPTQIMITPENMNKKVAITSRISALIYLWGSSIKVDKDKIKKLGLEKQVLIHTSSRSWERSSKGGSLTARDIGPQSSYPGNFPVAVMLKGRFPDMYEGKEIPEWPGEKDKKDKKKETSQKVDAKPAKMVLIGNGKMFNDNFIEAASNLVLILNSVDALTLGEELINIRGKSQTLRPVGKVSAGQRLFYRFFTIFMMPILVMIAGIARFLLRRRQKEALIY
ncbi:MAG: Gldg family protein [bacterium]